MILLKTIIEDRGLSQVELERLTGVAQNRLSLLINGKCRPTRPEARKLSKFFGDWTIEILLRKTNDEN